MRPIVGMAFSSAEGKLWPQQLFPYAVKTCFGFSLRKALIASSRNVER